MIRSGRVIDAIRMDEGYPEDGDEAEEQLVAGGRQAFVVGNTQLGDGDGTALVGRFCRSPPVNSCGRMALYVRTGVPARPGK